MVFTGFPVAALDFYEDLEADNSKSWWTAHKAVYDECVRAPMTELLAELEPQFGAGKVFRPYRDVRFSKDKTPYKTHQGGFVDVRSGLGYYVQVDASGLFVAGGFYQHTPDRVARYRAAVDGALRGGQLERITADLRTAGFEIGGDRLKTQPRGFATDHPRIDLLRHRSLTAGRAFGAPEWLATARAATEVAAAWTALTPLVEWSSDVLGDPS